MSEFLILSEMSRMVGVLGFATLRHAKGGLWRAKEPETSIQLFANGWIYNVNLPRKIEQW